MSEEYRAIDIRQELPQRLEAAGEKLRSKWLGHVGREIAISVAASIALIIGIGYFADIQIEWAQYGRGAAKGLGDIIVFNAIKAPKSFLNLMAIGFFILFLTLYINNTVNKQSIC